PLKTYDASLDFLRSALDRAKLGDTEKIGGFRRLDQFVQGVETQYAPRADFKTVVETERALSLALDGRSVFDRPENRKGPPRQMDLFST
ncbi:MAG TPA: hypothetical protein VN428_25100, partial [Bryobacteraceae bacterium]|nr:hypothetical protein [Bryobacteraceae bacterium]